MKSTVSVTEYYTCLLYTSKEVLSILRGDIEYEKDRYDALLNNMDSVFYDSKQDIILN